MREAKHVVLGLAVVVPFVNRSQIDVRDLPAAQRVVATAVEALQLHFPTDIEIELEKVDAVACEHALDCGASRRKSAS